tara:strand:+ start:21236 stop:21769 length:534 start_codon:yes stop_codon:yes gene_type:complete
MKKQTLIRKFIEYHTPTYKQLQIFCKYCHVIGSDATKLPTITKSNTTNVSFESFVQWVFIVDKTLTKNKLKVNGYYCTNISFWRSRKNIIVKNGRYYLTKECIEEGNSLYTFNKSLQLKHYKKLVKHYRHNYNLTFERLRDANRKHYKQKDDLEDVQKFLETFRYLIYQFNKIEKNV